MKNIDPSNSAKIGSIELILFDNEIQQHEIRKKFKAEKEKNFLSKFVPQN